MKKAVFKLALHCDDKEAIIEKMADKMSIWSLALDGPPLKS